MFNSLFVRRNQDGCTAPYTRAGIANNNQHSTLGFRTLQIVLVLYRTFTICCEALWTTRPHRVLIKWSAIMPANSAASQRYRHQKTHWPASIQNCNILSTNRTNLGVR